MRAILPSLLAVLTTTAFCRAEQADVVVVAATPAGVAAAVAAAKGGAKVILLEESAHVGGILAGGLTNTDIRKAGAVGGLFNGFKSRIVEYYTVTYGAGSPEVKLCREGNMFEPHIAEKVFRDMLAAEKNLRLIEHQRVVAAHVINAGGAEHEAVPGRRIDGAPPKDFGPTTKLVSLTAEDVSKPGTRTEFRAGAFIDCTYEGDVAALAGVPYRVGRESRSTFNEAHAGQIFIRFGDSNPLPVSTGAADDGIQAFCFRFHVTKIPENRVPVEKPATFNRADYKHLLAQIAEGKVTKFTQVIQLYPMPGGNYEVNSDHPHPDTGVPAQSLDLAQDNWSWPEASPQERARMFDRYWSYNEGMVWLLQHDEAVPQSIRDEAMQWGFPKNEFTDHHNRPHHIYVRQGRRIWGGYTLTENDAKPVPGIGLPPHQPDGIAVAEYPFDCHAVGHYDPAHPMLRPGYFYVDHEPLQLPYRILVPKCVDGLLVPVACSTSHVGYQAVRMEPVFMALGEACGIAAKTALDAKAEVRAVNVREVRREIVKRGGVVLYEEAALKPEDL